MKLGINGWRINGLRTGVGRYLLNIVKYWTADVVADKFDEINFYTPKPIDRQEIPIPENIRIRVLTPDLKMLIWENLRFGPVADEDVLFCPSYSRPMIARGKIVVATHDAIPVLYPEYFSHISQRLLYNPLYGWSARNANLVVTNTDAARQDIARCWKVPLSKIRDVDLASAEHFKLVEDNSIREEVRTRYMGGSIPYFLFVGKMTGRRNMPLLLESFAEFKRNTSFPHKLLLVGLNLHKLGLTERINDLGLENQVIHSGYVSDEDLNLIYNAAEALVMPSVYETVNLPIMEAQAVGIPVICIDTAGNRDITGEDAMLLPKLEVGNLAEAMKKLADNKTFRDELGKRGLANSKRFSWKRCAIETLAVLEEAAQM